MQPVSHLSGVEARKIVFLLTDVDDTITTKGKLRPAALSALYRLQDAGIRTICVTGGSAGWGDTYLRQWPIEAVLSESGAVCLYREHGVIRQFVHPSIVQEGYKERAQQLIHRVLSTVPGAKVSSDQFARLYDVAFDHGSEPPYLDSASIEKVVGICQDMGAGTAVSSIHINAWFGSFDKYQGSQVFFEQVLGINEQELLATSCFCGDAPNDQVMFARFPLSFGVGNLKKKEKEMQFLPTYIAKGEGGEGFAEIVDTLLDKRYQDL
ncbi:MAG: HAD-IIB family hydrolase [Sphaerochaetaceae bacterium]